MFPRWSGVFSRIFRITQMWKNTMTVWRYSSKICCFSFWLILTQTFWTCYCCSFVNACCQSQTHTVFLLVIFCRSLIIFFLARLLLSSCFCPPPFVVSSPHTSLQHFNLCRCSPSLKAVQLNASPPWLCSVDSATPPWLHGTMALHKGPRSILHLRHKISPALWDSRSKSHSSVKHTHTQYLHTNAHTHWCLSGLSCLLHTVL